MIYNVARVRRLFTKFQVVICKTKKDTYAHAQLRTLQFRSKTWFIMWQESGGYLQNFKSIHTKLKELDLRLRNCAPCNCDSRHDLLMLQVSGDYVQNFKSIRQKNKNFHFGGHFWGSIGGRGIRLRSISNLDWSSQWLKEPKYEFW